MLFSFLEKCEDGSTEQHEYEIEEIQGVWDFGSWGIPRRNRVRKIQAGLILKKLKVREPGETRVSCVEYDAETIMKDPLYVSFLKAWQKVGLPGEPDLDDFESYCHGPHYWAHWEDANGSLEWIKEWERSERLVRTYASKGALEGFE